MQVLESVTVKNYSALTDWYQTACAKSSKYFQSQEFVDQEYIQPSITETRLECRDALGQVTSMVSGMKKYNIYR